jgi:hypothetical protein
MWGRNRGKIHEDVARLSYSLEISLERDTRDVLFLLCQEALYRAVLADVLQRPVRANVPDTRGEVRPEQECEVNQGARVEAERRPHL